MLRHIPSSKSCTSFFDPGKGTIWKLPFLEYHQDDVQILITQNRVFPARNYQRLYHGLGTERHGFFYPFLLKIHTIIQNFPLQGSNFQGFFQISESKFWDALTCVPKSFTETSSPWAGFHNQQPVVPWNAEFDCLEDVLLITGTHLWYSRKPSGDYVHSSRYLICRTRCITWNHYVAHI